MRITSHVSANQARSLPTSARAQRSQIARLNLRQDAVIWERPLGFLAAAHVVRIAVRKDHDISSREFDGRSIVHLYQRPAIEQEMIRHDIRLPYPDVLRNLRRGRH